MKKKSFCVLDIETIDFKPRRDHIWSISILKISDMEVFEVFDSLVRPPAGLEQNFYRASGKGPVDFEYTYNIDKVASKAYNFINNDIVYAYNAPFDHRFLVLADTRFKNLHYRDYLKVLKDRYSNLSSYKLKEVAKIFNIDYKKNGFVSVDDCYALFELIKKVGL